MELSGKVRSLLVSRIYGPVWQGEGRQRGRLACFVRTGGCNLSCSWCDTPYAVFFDERKAKLHQSGRMYDPQVELTRYPPQQIVEGLCEMMPKGGLVVITGGEPLLQIDALYGLVDQLDQFPAFHIAFETAGTISPGKLAIRDYYGDFQWNVSPKLENSGNPLERRYRPEVLHQFQALNADFKFVVSSEGDFHEIDRIVEEINIPPRNVWIMPEGETGDKLLQTVRSLEDSILHRGWNMTLRDHILLYGSEEDR